MQKITVVVLSIVALTSCLSVRTTHEVINSGTMIFGEQDRVDQQMELELEASGIFN